MTGKTYLVTGGSRRIGLEYVRQLSSNPQNKVIATARDPTNATKLQKLVDVQNNVYAIPLEISSQESIKNLEAHLQGISKDGIDVLIQNAAISKSVYKALDAPEDVYIEHYRINVLSPILLTKALYKYLKLKDTRQLIYISSLAGSITAAFEMSSSAYGQSKAALNYTVKELSWELSSEG